MTTKYNKLDPIDHILHRPDMYVGSTRKKSSVEYISSEKDFKISEKNIEFPPSLLRIFIEPLSNAIDNVSRSKTKCTYIKISVCKKTGETRIKNDGDSIVIEINPENNCYNHSLIFGQLLTSSNYDDKQERYNISGRNGMGVKCTNVFSQTFTVSGCNDKKLFTQTWTNNMKNIAEPVITKCKDKNFTEIVYTPDFEKFGIKKYTDDVISMYRRYCVDASMLTGIEVYFNDVLIPVSNLKDYSNLFYQTVQETSLHIETKEAEVVLIPCENTTFTTVSFVNGVYTSQGGSHVDAWSEALFRPIVQKLTSKGTTYTIGDIKKFFNVFVSVKITNPEFESQSKHKLESPVNAVVKKKDIDLVLKWDIISLIRLSKESLALKKLERKKKTFIKIDGLDPANYEAGKHSQDCTLILVEGLSAKTYAAQGIEIGAFGKKGRDWFGIYALTGKLLNVRNAKPESISKNKVISDIIKALGLSSNLDYSKESNLKTLRYGKIMIITDQDCDGFHISGLIQNMIHYMFPSLLEKNSFITSMQTPIVRVYLSNKKEKVFYDEREYEKYVQDNTNINKKYYKGLGSSSSQDITDTFGKKIVEFVKDDTLAENMNKVFNSKNSDDRKEWLENYDSEKILLKWTETIHPETQTFKMSDFLNTEMIKFSLNDCKRSLPCIMDGLKESQRKTLYACFLKKLNFSGKTLKVAQLAGFIAEKTAYHHGEQNLYDTITKMAHDFPGSNNIPLLFRDGQFGSRLSGGKDAANARYIHTKLDVLTRLLFRPEDDVLLENIIEDGEDIEPMYFVPILPTVLINGCIAGIGTGWSCSIPCYNPKDVVKCVKCWLNNEEIPEIIPWYRGFTGEIVKSSEGRYISWGTLGIKQNSKVVSELPVGMWTDNFKDFLDDLLEQKSILKVKNYSTPKKIEFVISEGETECTRETLKLSKSVSCTNMVLFDEDNKIKKYANTTDIIKSFCEIRMIFYIKRKKHMLNELNTTIKFLSNKKRFLECVINGDIALFEENGKTRTSRKISDLNAELELKEFDKDKDEGSYDYLLRLQFKSITEEKIKQLEHDIDSNIVLRDELQKKSEKDLWINDISEFEKEYSKIQ